tara:strand:+ start:853 stop:1329 length:477 start_codon:yes stop_codon:yes gene_type:complete
MKKYYLYLSILFFFIILFINYYFNFYKNYEPFSNNLNYDIKNSKLLDNGERGLFAKKDYKKGENVEICPTIKMDGNKISNDNILHDFFFKANNSNKSLLSLGYCGLLNHSEEKQNCNWKVSKNNNKITMYATKPIKKGQELITNYGSGYWAAKNYKEI